jgi:hypothetical protein
LKALADLDPCLDPDLEWTESSACPTVPVRL